MAAIHHKVVCRMESTDMFRKRATMAVCCHSFRLEKRNRVSQKSDNGGAFGIRFVSFRFVSIGANIFGGEEAAWGG